MATMGPSARRASASASPGWQERNLPALVADHEVGRHAPLLATDLGAQHVHAGGLEDLLHEVEDRYDGAGRAAVKPY